MCAGGPWKGNRQTRDVARSQTTDVREARHQSGCCLLDGAHGLAGWVLALAVTRAQVILHRAHDAMVSKLSDKAVNILLVEGLCLACGAA